MMNKLLIAVGIVMAICSVSALASTALLIHPREADTTSMTGMLESAGYDVDYTFQPIKQSEINAYDLVFVDFDQTLTTNFYPLIIDYVAQGGHAVIAVDTENLWTFERWEGTTDDSVVMPDQSYCREDTNAYHRIQNCFMIHLGTERIDGPIVSDIYTTSSVKGYMVDGGAPIAYIGQAPVATELEIGSGKLIFAAVSFDSTTSAFFKRLVGYVFELPAPVVVTPVVKEPVFVEETGPSVDISVAEVPVIVNASVSEQSGKSYMPAAAENDKSASGLASGTDFSTLGLTFGVLFVAGFVGFKLMGSRKNVKSDASQRAAAEEAEFRRAMANIGARNEVQPQAPGTGSDNFVY